ncbi:MAG: hypothetical protein OIF58_15695 [Cohaesibacter sp.]|nr:hypothetical protein [Cohaesibacter sp.]
MKNTNDPFKTNGNNTYAGSTNQGKHEARTCTYASPQQQGESATSYQTRMNSYNQEKKKRNS